MISEYDSGSDFVCVAPGKLAQLMAEVKQTSALNTMLRLAMVTVGHDSRQRLHTLFMTLDLLSRDDESAKHTERVRSCRANVQRLAADLEQFVAQSELASTEKMIPTQYPFRIAGLLETVRQDWQMLARSKQLSLLVCETDAVIVSNQRMLSSILDNLVANAVKHTLEGEVRVDCDVQGSSLVVSIIDTGPGMLDVDCIDRQSFVPATSLGWGGMGIGLSIVRRTAELLGHELIMVSARSEGTMFKLRLPLGRASSTDVATADITLE